MVVLHMALEVVRKVVLHMALAVVHMVVLHMALVEEVVEHYSIQAFEHIAKDMAWVQQVELVSWMTNENRLVHNQQVQPSELEVEVELLHNSLVHKLEHRLLNMHRRMD